ncbi:MAG TPA: sialidase family protein [Acidimicrobiales bacterium]|nr:sialidase family protein [Acidimicrobiales bacterium]
MLFGVGAVASAMAAVFAVGDTRVGANVVASPDDAWQLVSARNSPTVTRNPTRPSEVVVVDRVDRPGFSAEVNWSGDGGRTWRHRSLPLPVGRDRPYAPDAVFARDGTLFFSYLNLEGTGNDPQTLWLAKSGDGGATLSAPVEVADGLVFQPRLAVGADRTVYLTWLQGSEVGDLSLLGAPAPVVEVRSTDGGATFSAPVRVSDASRRLVGAPSAVVGSDGSLFVLYEDFNGDVRDFENLDGPVWDSPFALVPTTGTGGRRDWVL